MHPELNVGKFEMKVVQLVDFRPVRRSRSTKKSLNLAVIFSAHTLVLFHSPQSEGDENSKDARQDDFERRCVVVVHGRWLHSFYSWGGGLRRRCGRCV